jgi:carboxyl-terminal processing protease
VTCLITEDHSGEANKRKPASNRRYNIPVTAHAGTNSSSKEDHAMSIKTKAAIVGSSAAVLLFMALGGLDGVRASNNDGSYRQLQVYSEVLSRVRSEYVEEPNIPAVTDGALHGLLESLDSNSSYLTPAEFKDFKSNQTEAKGDIGAAVSKRFGYAAVISVIPGGPADKAGVQASDIFEAIEGKSTRKMVEDGIGYIQVDAFNKGKAQEIAVKVRALQKAGAKRLILDLRNCAEGDESEGIAVANLFLNHGTITYLQGQKYPRQAFNADASKAISSLPLAVLVNKGTAGPAEVVAAAIMENARGDVVGDKTFGDGSVQKTIALPDGSALILSVAKYYSPSGKAIQDSAVTPNVVVADTDDDAALPDDDENAVPADEEKKQPPQQDEQLHKAIQVVKAKAS